ncbi:MAG: tetratricopeptide repeat protein [Scytonema sp. PMC 1069.18]|nr:tetratricopeptide repeat protein [Scytonema sp. PMC 1069.18]MEC4887252.1 tetratricopeptide repeat protein [Scytonema sp. PMC 1070.18]
MELREPQTSSSSEERDETDLETTQEQFLNLDEPNQDAYDDLIVSIEAKKQGLNLLIAVCDDAELRDRIIAEYENELQPCFRCYRVTLARGEPSLKAAINKLVQQEEYLRQYNPAVITVTGAEQLYFLKLGNERSEQEIFFGYLQWTREALRDFPYAIVLWVTNQILVNLSQKSPDFWSWRNGVFRFVSKKTNAVFNEEHKSIRFVLSNVELVNTNDNNSYFLPIKDLQELIQQIEQRGEKNSSLATLYSRLGEIYKRRLERGEAQDYRKEQDLAIEYFMKAAELQQELGLERNLPTAFHNIALLYYAQGRYTEAEALYKEALELRKRLFGEENLDVAQNLNDLAELYQDQGRFQEAELLYQQALELRKRLLGNNHPDFAISLGNLAELYRSIGRYTQAEPLYLQALELTKRLLGDNHPNFALLLNNVALLYYSQGRYGEAELLSQQAIEIDKRSLGEENPGFATDLHNLALIYRAQGRYQEAELLFLQALNLKQRLLPKEHPLVADTIYALGNMYRQQGRYNEAEPLCVKALELDKRLLGDNHPNVAESLYNLAELYRCTQRFTEAEALYQQALGIREQVFGVSHPKTVTVRKSIEELRSKILKQ